MSDLKLFNIKNGINEIEGKSATLEKSLQNLIEKNLNEFLGIDFVASEFSTGKKHRGRIDTLGLDENNSPVIIEYKRNRKENVINQGLFYLDWLMDHKATFEKQVREKLGQEKVDNIDWLSPRLLCIAGDFTRYDEHAVQQINRNIELIRYTKFGDDLILFELVNVVEETKSKSSMSNSKTVKEYFDSASKNLKNLYYDIENFAKSLGDDVQIKELKNYYAFKRLRNFACVEIHPQSKHLTIYIKGDFDKIDFSKDYIRDVREIGHYGTGDIELIVKDNSNLEKVKELISDSYEMS